MSKLSASLKNRRLAFGVAGVAAAMVGAAYAAVPLYFEFCRATGYGGTTQVAREASAMRGQRILTVRFDANVAPGLDWTFEPEVSKVSVQTGATTTVFFKVHNKTDHDTAATAVFNVDPDVSGAWFDKISCFCFSEQKLGPHESAELPVVFFLDPGLEHDADMARVNEITLSYTLYASTNGPRPIALAPAPTGGAPKL